MNLKQAKKLRKKLAYHPMLERSYDWIEFKDINGGPSSYMCVNFPDSPRAVYQYDKKMVPLLLLLKEFTERQKMKVGRYEGSVS